LIEDLALGREAAFVLFREDHFLIDGHDEDSAAAANDLAVDAELAFDLSRQTGGSGEVVSNPAVVDSYVHVLVASGQWPVVRSQLAFSDH
jgi:hypothetical protein